MNDFDRWIKGELENHEATRPEAAWDRFASRLDASDAQESESAQFDTAMKDKLAHFEASYQEQHWKLFSRKLEEHVQKRARMLQLKVVEGALLLLILLTLWNLHSTDTLLPSSGQPIAQMPSSIQDDSPGMSDHKMPAEQRINPDTEVINSIVSETSPPPRPSRATAMLPLTRQVRQVSLNRNQEDLVRFNEPTPNTTLQAENTFRHSIDILDPIASQEPAPLESLVPDPPSIAPGIRSSHPRHKVSMAIHGDLNYVMTPYDQLLVKNGYDQLVSGYGGTIGYLREGAAWSWRANMAYSRAYYLPKPYTEVFDGDLQRGYFAETIRDIELNMISLSLQVQWTLKRRNQWHSYIVLGGTGHLAFQANYDRKQSYIPGADPNPGGTPEPQTQSKTSQKRYADGFFEGGSLAENSYMTLDLGFGLENQLNQRVSVFIEPVYQHNPFKKSLGPNNDRINTLSTALGTRISF